MKEIIISNVSDELEFIAQVLNYLKDEYKTPKVSLTNIFRESGHIVFSVNNIIKVSVSVTYKL